MQGQELDQVMIIDFSEEQMEQMKVQHLEQTRRFLQSTEPYRIEVWYEPLKEFTFKSVFFQLTTYEAYLIQKVYYGSDGEGSNQPGLAGLRERVSSLISANFPGGCFAKLSTRSAKDYSWDFREKSAFESAVTELQKALTLLGFKEIGGRKPNTKEWNIIYQSILEVTKDRLKVSNGQDFIDMFTKSDRIVIDIGQIDTVQGRPFKQFSQGDYSQKDLPFIKVCLRQWRSFKWESQFRCFFNQYQLTAITPYVQDAVYSIDEAQVKERIVEYFGKMLGKLKQLGLHKGVLDVSLLQSGEIIMIEINTFDVNSRGSLFSWKDDKEIIEKGPLTMRTLKEYPEDILVKFHALMGMIEKEAPRVVIQALRRIDPLIDTRELA